MLREGRSKRDVARRLGIGFGTLHRALAAADPEPSTETAAADPQEPQESAHEDL